MMQRLISLIPFRIIYLESLDSTPKLKNFEASQIFTEQFIIEWLVSFSDSSSSYPC